MNGEGSRRGGSSSWNSDTSCSLAVDAHELGDEWLAYGAAMKGQGKVKGILVEGNDRHEYLLGFGPDNSPIFSRRQADGTFEPLEDVWRASKVAITPSAAGDPWRWTARQ
jgi:hypothetical protein